MTKLAAVTRVMPRPGAFEDLCACADRMVAATGDEEGTEVYLVARATGEPEMLFLFEFFADKTAFKAHAAQGRAIGEMLAPFVKSVDVILGEPLAAKGLDM